MIKQLVFITLLAAAFRLGSEPLATSFTYQGELQVSGSPANGIFDMEFELYDELSNGLLVGATVTVDDVPVTNGVFSVELDFGPTPFAGDQLWLDINVRTGTSTGGYTNLLPRQRLSATPYALHAEMVAMDAISGNEIANNSVTAADLAASAVTSTELAAGAVRTSNVNADEIQLRVSGDCTAGGAIQTVNQDGSVSCIASVDGEPGPPGADGDDLFERTIVVRTGGTAVENGLAYVAALNTVTAGAPSETNPWVIQLEPGDYLFNTAPPNVPGSVRVRGAGVDVTTFRCVGCVPMTSTGAISVTDLTVRSDSNSQTMRAAGARLERVVIENTNKSGDVLVIVDGNLTLIDSTLRARLLAETGVGQFGLLVTNATIDIRDSVLEGFRPRTTLNDVTGTIRGSSFRSIFLSGETNEVDIRDTKIDATPSELSGGGLIGFGSSNSSVNNVSFNNVEIIGFGSITGVSVGTNTTILMQHSSAIGGRIFGNGTAHLRHVTVDDPVSAATRTCFAVVRLDNSTFSGTTCP